MIVYLVDTATLAVQTLKDHKELLPVNFVPKGVNADGQPEGWVDSPFEAMILGFGETGQDMLGFLYEYGGIRRQGFQEESLPLHDPGRSDGPAGAILQE